MAKQRYKRREFMGLSGAGVAGLIGGGWPRTALAQLGSPQDPDLIVFNARVYTIDPIVRTVTGGNTVFQA